MALLARHWIRIAVTLLPLVLGAAACHRRSAASACCSAWTTCSTTPGCARPCPGRWTTRIVIVDIDEKSLAEVGRWPWSRNRLAELADELFDRQQVALLGFDVVFAEPDESSGLKRLRQLAQGELKDQPGFAERARRSCSQRSTTTRLFAKALEKRPVVLGYYFTSDREGRASGVAAGAGDGARRACRAGRSRSPAGTATAPTSSSSPRPRRWPGFFNSDHRQAMAWCAPCRCWPSTRASTTSRWRWPCSGCWRARRRCEPGFPREKLRRPQLPGPGQHAAEAGQKQLARPGGRQRGRAGAVPRPGRRRAAARSATSRPPTCWPSACRRQPEGQDRAGRHHRAGPAGPAGHAGGRDLSRAWRRTPT